MASLSSRGRGRRTINEINMVPFIDVMLVLLIIFMVTAPMITPSMIDLPSVGKAAKQPDQVVQVVIQKNERLELVSNGKTDSTTLGSVAGSVLVGGAETLLNYQLDPSLASALVLALAIVLVRLRPRGIVPGYSAAHELLGKG